MIETPVRAQPPSGPPSAPPPDAHTRVMDPPPDPGGRHVHACRACGSPIHEDQAACLSCGAMVERGDSRAGIRRAALGSATALLVLGGAVGAAVAGLPHGKHVPKAAIAHVFGKKAPPPATADPNATANGDTTLPGAGTGTATPPAIHPSSPHNTKTPSSPSTSSSSPSGSSSGSGGSPSGGTPSKKHHSSKRQGSGEKKDQTAKSAGPALFAEGDYPVDAGEFDASGHHPSSGKSGDTIDRNARTAWSTTTAERGVYVQSNGASHRALGVVTKTPGYAVEVRYTTAGDPPDSLTDWKPASSISSTSSRQKFSLPSVGRDATYYLVRITDLNGKPRALLNGIQLLP